MSQTLVLCSRLSTHPTTFSYFMRPSPPKSTLFPYTTLFRSQRQMDLRGGEQTRSRRQPRRGAGGEISGRRLQIGRHTSELQSRVDLVCRLLLEKKNKNK